LYDLSLVGLRRGAGAHSALVQNGYLRRYLLVVIGSAGGLGWFTLVTNVHLPWPAIPVDVTLFQLGLAALILIAAFVAASSGSRLAAVAALGVVGYGVALLFIFFGAPDLAMTQFMVETLTVILFVLAFYHLPRLRGMSTMPARVRDAAVALVAGGFVTALVLAANAARADSRVAAAYADQSYVLGHGRNIVNVILVDFRALDTMGEITVLGVAAIGVFMLLRPRSQDEAGAALSSDPQPQPIHQRGEWTTGAGGAGLVSSLILRTSTRFLVTLLLLFAVFLLLRGHNDPGGGFVGGLVCSAAFALHGIAEGAASARRALRIRPSTLIAIGLLVAVGTGLAPLLQGEPFLTGLWDSIGLPGMPHVDVGSPLLFDIGVFLVVVGVTQTIFLSLAEA
jgi:multicomponent Na+:H+ antiporter subunit A